MTNTEFTGEESVYLARPADQLISTSPMHVVINSCLSCYSANKIMTVNIYEHDDADSAHSHATKLRDKLSTLLRVWHRP